MWTFARSWVTQADGTHRAKRQRILPTRGKLLGRACQAGHQNRNREKLFRVDSAMPLGCPIKAKLALRAVGYEGIYPLTSCGSYLRQKRVNRWFCSEEDAQAAGFRKSLTCR